MIQGNGPASAPDDDGVERSQDAVSFSEAPTEIGSDPAADHGDDGRRDGMPFPGASVILADRYELEEAIASGGAAVVWRAFDRELSRSVAIKLLHPHLATDEVTVERFRLESVNAARLSHPNVIQIYDTGREHDIVFLVMEHVDGPSLRDVLAQHGRLQPELVAALGEQVAAALGEAHSHGVVHRDIKPANILLTADGVPKVTDFGIAKALSGAGQELTNPGTVVGTAAYVAPEQLEAGEVDARADVYALGVVLYECLTGQPAFTGDTPTATAAARLTREVLSPQQVRPGVPRALDEIVITATRRDPELRYRDGNTMSSALAQVVSAEPSDLTARLVAMGPSRPAPPRDGRPTDEAEEADTADWIPVTRREYGRRLALAFLGGLVLAAIAFLGVRALQTPTAEQAGPDGRGSNPFPISQAQDFDPFAATPGEHPGQVPLAHDGDRGTAWTTETYRGEDPRFGGLKPGVGLWFDLGENRTVSSAVVQTTSAGVGLELYAAQELPDDLAGWGPTLAEAESNDQETVLELPQPMEGRYWLVWITSLPATGDGRLEAGLAEVRFFAP